jgi:hypothetical protein
MSRINNLRPSISPERLLFVENKEISGEGDKSGDRPTKPEVYGGGGKLDR